MRDSNWIRVVETGLGTARVGRKEGSKEGRTDGPLVGVEEGDTVGKTDGLFEGLFLEGFLVFAELGLREEGLTDSSE